MGIKGVLLLQVLRFLSSFGRPFRPLSLSLYGLAGRPGRRLQPPCVRALAVAAQCVHACSPCPSLSAFTLLHFAWHARTDQVLGESRGKGSIHSWGESGGLLDLARMHDRSGSRRKGEGGTVCVVCYGCDVSLHVAGTLAGISPTPYVPCPCKLNIPESEVKAHSTYARTRVHECNDGKTHAFWLEYGCKLPCARSVYPVVLSFL